MINRTVLITGANTGIGRATAEALATKGASLILACRNTGKGEAVRREIAKQSGNERLEVMELDLASFTSIRKFAESVNKKYDRLHVLINNAGTMANKRTETEDGLELTIGVNHFGTFLLTGLLTGLLKESGNARIVTVSSIAHRFSRIRLDDLHSKRRYLPSLAYGQSKLANLLFNYELSRRLNGTGVTANCLHPGFVNTPFTQQLTGLEKWVNSMLNPLLIPVDKGAATSVYLASSPEVEGVTGKYFARCREARASKTAYDASLARRLWEISEETTGLPTTL
ncbi:SDR family NAD(P)-dependent oxidoreductase [Cohnella sp. CFH 77786]|uniref:SDR family oxidoreductase n=1 Tax=Cohnella sp. CFH 77786 TaxID=2662265 RepID=UPI001C60AB90|nr:SDR family oxidoreductase [Cohnella sp. CFH 77786]MBW5445765.1 SDR family NAD(P)-dependent oxidoreductase [Cohnella sp. CFH 77786]